jgi:hypothetical protein
MHRPALIHRDEPPSLVLRQRQALLPQRRPSLS